MPEARRIPRAVLACHAEASTLDALVPPGLGARTLRVAPDEILVVSNPQVSDRVLREVHDRVTTLERDALLLDVTDGWAALSIAGPDTGEAFAAVSPLEAPGPGAWTQGDVARVPAKVLGEGDGSLTILVASYHEAHLRERAFPGARASETEGAAT